MNFFLDHDVPADVGRVLRLKGHVAQVLGEVLPKTTDDLAALRYASSREWVMVTCNRRDFLRLAEAGPNVTQASSSWSGGDRVSPNAPPCFVCWSGPANPGSSATLTSLEVQEKYFRGLKLNDGSKKGSDSMKFRNHVLALIGVGAFIVCVMFHPAFSRR